MVAKKIDNSLDDNRWKWDWTTVLIIVLALAFLLLIATAWQTHHPGGE